MEPIFRIQEKQTVLLSRRQRKKQVCFVHRYHQQLFKLLRALRKSKKFSFLSRRDYKLIGTLRGVLQIIYETHIIKMSRCIKHEKRNLLPYQCVDTYHCDCECESPPWTISGSQPLWSPTQYFSCFADITEVENSRGYYLGPHEFSDGLRYFIPKINRCRVLHIFHLHNIRKDKKYTKWTLNDAFALCEPKTHDSL